MFYLYLDAGLCAVHAINNLLQGPFVSEIDLMNVAHQLDAREREMMAEQGITSDYLKFAAVCWFETVEGLLMLVVWFVRWS